VTFDHGNQETEERVPHGLGDTGGKQRCFLGRVGDGADRLEGANETTDGAEQADQGGDVG